MRGARRLPQLESAYRALKQGDLDAAARDFAQAAAAGQPIGPMTSDHAITLSRLGRHDAAITVLEPWFARSQTDATVVNLMGVLLKRAGRLTEAERALQQARDLSPQEVTAWQNLGNLYHQMGRVSDALACYQAALAIAPTSAELWRMLAQQQAAQGDLAAACDSLTTALTHDPDNRVIATSLVQSLQRAGRLADAQAKVAALRAAAPEDVDVKLMEASVTFQAGQPALAENMVYAVLMQQPGHLRASLMLAGFIGDKDRATVNAVLEQAVARHPESFEALDRLVESLTRSRYGSEAAHIERAYTLARDLMDRFPARMPEAGRSLRTILMRVLDEDRMARTSSLAEMLPVWLARGAHAFVHYELGQVETLEDRVALVEWHRAWGRQASAGIMPLVPLAQPALATGRKLRIGFMSSDLRHHPISYFALPLLEGYDRDRVEVFCYSFYDRAADRVQQHIAGKVTAFHHWPKRADAQVAEDIAADGLDILFELGGSTAMNKLGVMAYRPARLGASWLGYPHSAGLEQIDLILTDPYIRPDDPRLLIERPFEMPETWVALSRMFGPHVIADGTPEDRKGHLTFGTANNPYKFTTACLDAWAAVLRAVPGSRFVFIRPEGAVESFQLGAQRAFARRDVDPGRIGFIGVRGDHMRHYNEIDIALDSLPHVGGTNTCEALWMGVPTVSLVGAGFPERLSYSNLSNAGLADLAVFSVADYVATAAALAADPARRRALRAGMRAQIAAHPLGQPGRFTQHFYDLARRVAAE